MAFQPSFTIAVIEALWGLGFRQYSFHPSYLTLTNFLGLTATLIRLLLGMLCSALSFLISICYQMYLSRVRMEFLRNSSPTIKDTPDSHRHGALLQ